MPGSISDGLNIFRIGHEYAGFVNKIFGDFALVIVQISFLLLNGFTAFQVPERPYSLSGPAPEPCE